MGTRARTIGLILFFSVYLLGGTVTDVFSAEYDALKGVKSIKAVFDVRTGKSESAVGLLQLIHNTFKDKSIRIVTEKPDFVIVFIGPAVRLVSNDRDSFSSEEQKTLDALADTIKAMSKEGIKFEICMVAAKVFGVKASSILPEIKQVHNGWISLIGYQAKGYSLVPVY